LEILAGSSDAGSGILEDELRVALGRQRSNEIQLALGEFYHRLLAVIAKKELAHILEHKHFSRLP